MTMNKRNTKTIVTRVVTAQPNTMTKRKRNRNRGKKRRANGNRSYFADPFVSTLCDPEHILGVKWPGPTGVPTGTFQLTTDFIGSTLADGSFGVIVVPQSVNPGGPSIGNYATITASAAAYTWTGGTAFPGSTSAATIYDSFRVVSGCINLEHIGNTANDQGLAIGWWDIFNSNNQQNAPQTYGNAQITAANIAMSKAYSSSYPVRNGMCVRWRPADYSDSEFITPNPPAGVLVPLSMPVIGIVVTGAAPSVAIFKVRIVFNYEGIPGYDTTNFVNNTQASPPAASLERAAAWGRDMSDKITDRKSVV